ncbi:2,3-bisphosphoglycerate-dependent phosphoglycerate [Musa troglodytarum]|uniref:2,3-bisphosphoglycerate-dependent phosphoglycerate n=1 Tax=Musa troglodytarum TaxID=320322 RepID=A0A9E7HYK2_9LILI|nr:2,3-bisphosphoglycerate-dependent phosphoglycerate [Musa troglodytarum]URE38313.1 2,3-bisphosphoglycerate-dependent phosphoglycerate [Musa troglodytarum]URE38322.1 2,3-bisphosphoglycerate-dependent phosphoglycerate [Musa troglodytarum]
MCADRAVVYVREQIVPQPLSGENVMIAAHGNSLRSIIMYLDKLNSEEVISLELSTGIPMLSILKKGKFIRRGGPIGPSEAGVYAYTRASATNTRGAFPGWRWHKLQPSLLYDLLALTT